MWARQVPGKSLKIATITTKYFLKSLCSTNRQEIVTHKQVLFSCKW